MDLFLSLRFFLDVPRRPGPANRSGFKPMQAVQLAAAAAPRAVPGVFALQVQATGTRDNRTYLNSERDYRDQRHLTTAITPEAARQLQDRLGANPVVALKGKRILVRGAAVRTTIFFMAGGKPTDTYYFQTHVNVTESSQIEVQEGG